MASSAEQYETIEDALRDLVRALGGSKAVGAKLFPTLPIDQAAGRVSDCLLSLIHI